MARVKVQITTPSNNVIKVSPGVSALSSVQLYLNELIDVNSAHGAEGYVLTQQADGTFAMEAVATTLSDLSDTNILNPQGGDSLVYNAGSQKWVPGGVKSVNGQDGDVVITIPSPPPTPGVSGLADTNITSLQDDQIIRYDSFSGEWLNEDLEALPAGGTTGQALVKATGTDYDVEWADIAIDTQYHNRFATNAETFRSGATATTELYYTAKADGDGLAESASSDTPTAGKIIRRKIYYSEAAFADPDTGTWVEFTPAPADDAAFATVKAALLEYLKARTGGTVPISLKQTWEEVTAAPAFTGLLNETYGSGAEAAYSTRRLNGNVTDCMVIRRASDSTTTTIGFDGSGNISEADIISFCTGTTCTVESWLDQSGNGNDATAAAPANEPTIYTGGALVKEGGRLALDFDTTNVLIASSITINGQRSDFAVVTIDDITRENGIFNTDSVNDGTTSTDRYAQNINLDSSTGVTTNMRNLSFTSGGAVRQSVSNGVQEGVRHLLNGQYSGTTLSGYIDGVAKGSTTQTDQKTGTSHLAIGSSYQANRNLLDGKIQELITFQADKGSDRTDIEENIGDYFTQNTPLLDTYSGAAAAYSLRLLDSTYTGALVEVYNGSSYADIGANVFGELDTVALADHCGSNDGFVSKWYSQTGSNHATQTNTANMPKIYDGTTGAVIVDANGKPALQAIFNGGLDVSLSYSSTDLSLFGVYDNNSSANMWYVVADNTHNSPDGVIFYSSSADFGAYRSGWSTEINESQTNNLGVNIWNGSNLTSYLNGGVGAVTTSAVGTTAFNFTSLRLCRLFTAGTAYFSEMILYTSDQSANRTGIETNINTFYDIF